MEETKMTVRIRGFLVVITDTLEDLAVDVYKYEKQEPDDPVDSMRVPWAMGDQVGEDPVFMPCDGCCLWDQDPPGCPANCIVLKHEREVKNGRS